MTSLEDLKKAWENSKLPKDIAREEKPPWWVQEWSERTIEIGPLSTDGAGLHEDVSVEREPDDEPLPRHRRGRGGGSWAIDEVESDLDGRGQGGPRLPEPEHRRIEKSVEREGTEVLAWYQPFHFPDLPWGIYVREKGLLYLADFLEASLGSRPDSIQNSLLFLHAHEVCHGVIESVTTHQELSTLRPAYAYRNLGVAVPWPLGLTSRQVEEALSNATALRKRWPLGVKQVWEAFARLKQPRGYSDWGIAGKYADYSQVAELIHGLSGHHCGLLPAPWMPLHKWARGHEADFPVFLVRDAPPGRGIALAIRSGQMILAVRLAEHPPPHFEIENTRFRLPKRRYSYPFERGGNPPFEPVPPTSSRLTVREEAEVSRLIDEHKEKFLDDYRRQVAHLKAKYPDDGRLAGYTPQGEWVGTNS
jgi:hypothetical protein